MLEVPRKLDPFVFHEVEFNRESGGQYVGECPFCGKSNHFYVNAENALWDCKACGAEGNLHTFLGQIAELICRTTSADAYAELAKDRGLPRSAFKRWGLGYDGADWVIPTWSRNAPLGGSNKPATNIRLWNPTTKRLISTKGCPVGLYGARHLSRAKAGSRVWVCEGEWDAIALSHIFSRARLDDVVVAVPGASIFKDEWVEDFNG